MAGGLEVMLQNGATEESQQVEESSKTESRLNVKGRTPPLNFLAIVKDLDTSSVDKLCDQLYSGFFIDPQLYPGVSKDPKYPNTLRYWVDKKLNKNCFALYAREIKIEWSESPEYWRWNKEKEETSGEEIEVAQLIDVSWLDVKGTFHTIDLSPKTLYEVVFVIMVKNEAVFPVDITFILPNYKGIPTWRSQVRHASLEKMPRQKWIEIQVGEFEMSPENVGEVVFCLENKNTGEQKTGLVLKCVIFRPKNN